MVVVILISLRSAILMMPILVLSAPSATFTHPACTVAVLRTTVLLVSVLCGAVCAAVVPRLLVWWGGCCCYVPLLYCMPSALSPPRADSCCFVCGSPGRVPPRAVMLCAATWRMRRRAASFFCVVHYYTVVPPRCVELRGWVVCGYSLFMFVLRCVCFRNGYNPSYKAKAFN